jgi:preprotein translocase subunit YajC
MEILSYLFSPIPGISFNYYNHILIYSIVLIVLGVIFWFVLSRKKHDKAFIKTYRSAPSQFIWIGIILIILAASRVNGIAYLSMRFLLILFIGISVYIIVKSIYKYFKKYPEMQKVVKPKNKKTEEKEKYTTSKK